MSVWDNPPNYGTYTGARGNPEQWRSFFDTAWNKDTASEILQDESPWGILGIKADASKADIKQAFNKLMKVHHPDKGGDIEIAKKIIAAYVFLTETN